jgi:hypothetical protein
LSKSSGKKRDRARAAAGRAERERGRAKAARRRQTAEHYSQLNDPSASPAAVAGILAAEFPDQVLAADMMRVRVAQGVPAEEVAETARLLLQCAEPGQPRIGALAVAALAAHLAGDEEAEHGYARDLLARAGSPSPDPRQWLAVIGSAADRGHPGETCELIEPYLREHPDDELATEIYAHALAKAHAQSGPGELDRGGPGGRFPPVEAAALARYRDRSGADALDRAIGQFTERTRWGVLISKWIDDDRAGQKTSHWGDAEQDAVDALMAEVGVLFPFTGELSGAEDDDDDDAVDTPLRAFAADAETPAELAVLAAERDQHVRYGIWQVPNPSLSPGVWCTDLVSGIRQYAEFPAEVIDGAPPWSVWLGALAPSAGIWRASRTGLWLSPVEGDAIAEYAEDAVWQMLYAIAVKGIRSPAALEQPRFGQAEPFCVRWETDEEPTPGFGNYTSATTARLAPRLASWVLMKRAEPFLIQNTDGEPMVLIDVAVTTDGDVTERLLAHPDFAEEKGGEGGQLVWWGGPAGDGPSESTALHFHEDGFTHVTDPADEEERVVLARLTPDHGRVIVRVNSERRLKRVLQILTDIGAAPKVAQESRSQTSMEFAWGPVPGGGMTARTWAESWLDQPVVVLEFHTPRHAASSGQADLLRLEGLLRQLEYQSALPAERGGQPIDTAWLRTQLGLVAPNLAG